MSCPAWTASYTATTAVCALRGCCPRPSGWRQLAQCASECQPGSPRENATPGQGQVHPERRLPALEIPARGGISSCTRRRLKCRPRRLNPGGKATWRRQSRPLAGEDEIDAGKNCSCQPGAERAAAGRQQQQSRVIAKGTVGGSTIGQGQQGCRAVSRPGKRRRASRKPVPVGPATRVIACWAKPRPEREGERQSRTGSICFQAELQGFRKPCRAGCPARQGDCR